MSDRVGSIALEALLKHIKSGLLCIAMLVWTYAVLVNYFPRLNLSALQGDLASSLHLLSGARVAMMADPGAWLAKTGAVDLLLGLWVTLVAYGVGRKAIRWVRLGTTPLLEEALFSVGLGFGFLAYLTLTFGALALLYPEVAWTTLIALTLISVPGLREVGRRGIGWLCAGARQTLARPPDVVLTGFIGLFAVLYLVGALAPETQTDAIYYHLAVPKFYVQYGRIVNFDGIELPAIFYAHFPFNQEMLYTLALLLRGQILAKLLHFIMGFLCLLTIYSFCRRHLSPRIGLLAALLFYSAPLVGWESTTAYNELGITFFQTLAIYGVINWFYAGQKRWLILGAITLGLALGFKYTVVYALLPIAAIFALKIRKAHDANTLQIGRQLCVLLIISGLIFLPWLIKNLFFTGNPVYPFLDRVFHSPLWTEGIDDYWFSYLRDDYGMGRGLIDYLKLPWNLTMRGDRFVGTIGPIFLLFIPALPFLSWKPHIIRLSAGISSLLLVQWALASQQLRFFIPSLPWVAILAAYVIDRLAGFQGILRLASAVTIFVALGIIFLNLPFFADAWQGNWVLHFEVPFGVVLGEETWEQYLSHELAPWFFGYNYGTIQYINTNLPRSARVLVLESPPYFYLDRRVISTMDHVGVGYALRAAVESPEYAQRLKEYGITHLRVRGDQLHEDALIWESLSLVHEQGDERLYQVRNTERWKDYVDFDEDESADQLGIGWYPRDGEQGYYFRWTERESVVYLKSPGGVEKIIIEGFAPTQCFPQRRVSLSVKIDDLEVDQTVLDTSGDFLISLPFHPELERGVVAIRLRLSDTFVPDQCLKNGDLRNLGIAIRKISLM